MSILGRLNIVADKANAMQALGEPLNLDSALEKAARKAGVERFEAKCTS